MGLPLAPRSVQPQPRLPAAVSAMAAATDITITAGKVDERWACPEWIFEHELPFTRCCFISSQACNLRKSKTMMLTSDKDLIHHKPTVETERARKVLFTSWRDSEGSPAMWKLNEWCYSQLFC
ncbi:uncharacterized protein LOC110742498 isoform X2 [Papio anubis]|uniref:uncharacterized protein LOC110742498 isoform X2 n=1 Tax=Papio anubis TaxID=9555 RepID=UPI000B7B43FB|nr:uncharacterized protein LOC110742498 isoform X2 [Papio anubis]